MKNNIIPDKQTIAIRMPKDLLDRIDNEAEQEERDRSKQILYMLKKYFEMKEILGK